MRGTRRVKQNTAICPWYHKGAISKSSYQDAAKPNAPAQQISQYFTLLYLAQQQAFHELSDGATQYHDLAEPLQDWLRYEGVSSATDALTWMRQGGLDGYTLADAIGDCLERRYDRELEDATPDRKYSVLGLTNRKKSNASGTSFHGTIYRSADVSKGDAICLQVACAGTCPGMRLDTMPYYMIDDGRYLIKRLLCQVCDRKTTHMPFNSAIPTIRRDQVMSEYYAVNPDAKGAAEYRAEMKTKNEKIISKQAASKFDGNRQKNKITQFLKAA